MASQAECKRCFEAYIVIFGYILGVLVNATPTLLFESSAGKSDSVAAF